VVALSFAPTDVGEGVGVLLQWLEVACSDAFPHFFRWHEKEVAQVFQPNPQGSDFAWAFDDGVKPTRFYLALPTCIVPHSDGGRGRNALQFNDILHAHPDGLKVEKLVGACCKATTHFGDFAEWDEFALTLFQDGEENVRRSQIFTAPFVADIASRFV